MGVTVREKPKGSGRWRLFYNRSGKSKELPYTFRSRQAAEEVSELIRARIALGQPIAGARLTQQDFTAYAMGWLDAVRSQVKESTWKDCYRPILTRHVIPHFKDFRLEEVRPADVRTFLRKLSEQGLSASTQRLARTVLSMVLDRAYEDELIRENPVKRVRYRVGRRVQKKRFNAMTLLEVHRLLDTAMEHLPRWYAFFCLMAYTGMRLSEARGLRWQAVHFGSDNKDPRRYVRIEETVTMGRLSDDVTKTGRDRSVDLNHDARQALLDHHVEELSQGRGRPEDYVFCTASGLPVRKEQATRALTKACNIAGLERRTPGDFRHTYITIMLYEMEEDLLYVIDQVGHASVQMILHNYGHPERYYRPEKVDRLARRPATDRPSSASGPVSWLGRGDSNLHNWRQRPGSYH